MRAPVWILIAPLLLGSAQANTLRSINATAPPRGKALRAITNGDEAQRDRLINKLSKMLGKPLQANPTGTVSLDLTSEQAGSPGSRHQLTAKVNRAGRVIKVSLQSYDDSIDELRLTTVTPREIELRDRLTPPHGDHVELVRTREPGQPQRAQLRIGSSLKLLDRLVGPHDRADRPARFATTVPLRYVRTQEVMQALRDAGKAITISDQDRSFTLEPSENEAAVKQKLGTR
jgi:hypothetical protein